MSSMKSEFIWSAETRELLDSSEFDGRDMVHDLFLLTITRKPPFYDFL